MTTFAKTAPFDNALLRYAIGLNTEFFEQQASVQSTFPPHNIYQLGDGVFRLTLAVAGFTEDEIDIVSHNDVLTISGQKTNVDNNDDKLLYRGIAFRDFSRQFKIGEHVHVVDAMLDHGLLIVNLVREVPENLKPKQILISRN
jgi:molecular chaperone IbpA